MKVKWSKREQFAYDITKLIQHCFFCGYTVTLGEAFRTNEQQELHRKAGRSQVKVSQHQKRLAMDLHIWKPPRYKKEIGKDEWEAIGAYWLELSPKNEWGGNWKSIDDVWHFQRNG